MGGFTQVASQGHEHADVWSSADGANWTLETYAPWGPRRTHTSAVFNNRLWVIGGAVNGQYVNDVWASSDGVNWTQETASAPWHERGVHTTVVYRGRLWVIGGLYADSFASIRYNDAWSTTDGVNWTKETGSAPWVPRAGHASTVFNGRIWVVGGLLTESDVWSYGLHAYPDRLPDGTRNHEHSGPHPYSATLEAREGDAPFLWEMIGGSLPPGLFIDTSGTGDSIPITGMPTTVGEHSFTIRLTDNNGYTNEQPITIKINPPKPLQSSGSSGSGCALTARPAMAGPAGPATLALLATATAWAILRRRKVRSPSRRSRTDRPLADRHPRRDGAGYQIAEDGDRTAAVASRPRSSDGRL